MLSKLRSFSSAVSMRPPRCPRVWGLWINTCHMQPVPNKYYVHTFPVLVEQLSTRCPTLNLYIWCSYLVTERSTVIVIQQELFTGWVRLDFYVNKKVLLRERMRHTACGVASARFADGGGDTPSSPGRGDPIQSWTGGVPYPDLGWGTPLSAGWGTPPIQTWDGVPPLQTWDGVPPCQQDGGTPIWTWDGVPPLPHSGPRTGYPLPP